MPTIRKIVRDAAKDNYRFSSIVMGIVKSAPFEMRRVPLPVGEAGAERRVRVASLSNLETLTRPFGPTSPRGRGL